MAFRRGATREGNEMRLGATIELGQRRRLPRAWREGGCYSRLNKAPTDAGDGGQAHLQRLRDPLVCPTRTARRLIGFE